MDEKFQLIVGLQSADELSDDFTGIYATVALVSALMLSMLEIGHVEDVATGNMWGDSAEDVKAVYNMLTGITVTVSTFVVLVSVVLTTQLSHVPKDATKDLFAELGMGVMQAPGPLMFIQTLLFLTVLWLEISLVANAAVGYTVMVFDIVGTILFIKFVGFAIEGKMKVMRAIRKRKQQGEENDGAVAMPQTQISEGSASPMHLQKS